LQLARILGFNQKRNIQGNPMTRTFALLAAVAIAAPASAATYTGKLATPVSEARIVARDIVWNCGAGSCRGSTEESRPQVLCQSLAKKAGKLESFTVNGAAFAAADLDKCNAVAPQGSGPAK
jgi:hypothetical protein